MVHTTTTQQSSHIIAPPNNLSSTSGANQPADAKSTDYSRELLMNSTIKQPLAIHQRSQSLSGLQISKVKMFAIVNDSFQLIDFCSLFTRPLEFYR